MVTKFVESREVRELTCNVPYTQTTSTEIFELPKNARILMWIFNVKIALAGGTTTLRVGISSNDDYFVTATTLTSIGTIVPSTTVALPGNEPTAMVTKVYANVGASNTAGSIDVVCVFSMEQGTPL